MHVKDVSTHAAHVVRRTALAEGIATLDNNPVLHGDNGSMLKATTVLAMVHWLGVPPTYSCPRVSDDNAIVEWQLRNIKNRPNFQACDFADLKSGRDWAAQFVN